MHLFILIFLTFMVFGDSPKMNNIGLYDYGDFTKDWKLVTVRYRKDTGEMRFTYANPKAWQALTKKQIPYPDGSVFAKVGFKTETDPAFNSSVVPSGARRFQFMVKDAKKYSKYAGWGYALYQSDGKLFEGDIPTQTIACHACHQVVPERDYVFSEAIEASPFAIPATDEKKPVNQGFKFINYDLTKLNLKLSALIKKLKVKNLSIIDGPIREHYFGGTLDEITPVLINELAKNVATNQFYAVGFLSMDGKTYKIVSFNQDKKAKCSVEETSLIIYEDRTEWKSPQQQVLCYAKH